MKSVDLESFKNSNGKVEVILKMVFTDSNEDPAASLRSSMADGMLGQLAVDPTSLKFVEVKPSKVIVYRRTKGRILKRRVVISESYAQTTPTFHNEHTQYLNFPDVSSNQHEKVIFANIYGEFSEPRPRFCRRREFCQLF